MNGNVTIPPQQALKELDAALATMAVSRPQHVRYQQCVASLGALIVECSRLESELAAAQTNGKAETAKRPKVAGDA